MATTTYGTTYATSADLVSAWPTDSLSVANSVDAAGYYIGRGINAQTASYVGVITDAGKTITMTNASANTFTIPPNSSVAYPTGTRINILNLGAGACTPTAGVGVTISGTITALSSNQAASIVKTATNTWSYLPFISGAPALTSADVTSTTGSPTITTTGIYTVYKYSGAGTFVTNKTGTASVVITAGGGGGGRCGGGGGGGAQFSQTDVYFPLGTREIVIGAGGAGSTSRSANGTNGVASSLGIISVPGGGGGGSEVSAQVGSNGGSGGGGSLSSRAGGTAVISLAGFAGGTGSTDSCGGGGGGSTVGGTAVGNTGGNGGTGITETLTGTSLGLVGGGGGGAVTTAGTATQGGGAGSIATANANAGTINTGGGGGGSRDFATGGGNGGAGGSGLVIIRVVT